MSDDHRRRAGDSARARPATAARQRTSGRANGAPPLSLVREPTHDTHGADGEGAPEQTDGDIFARIAEGRGEAFAELYQRYFRELYDFAARITHDRTAAADVVQTVFATVWERARSGEEVRSPRAWLYRVAHNAAIDELRRRRWTSGEDGDQGFDFAALEATGSTDPERFLIEKELAELVWSTAATLTPEEYALLDLYVRRELGPDELADQLGITTGAVYTRLSRLRSSFEEALRATLLMRRRDCAELQDLVATLGPRAESPEGRDAVRAHIRSCSTCQEASGRYVTATEILASLAPVALVPGVQDAIWSSLSALLGLGAATAGGAGGSSAQAAGSAHAARPSLLGQARGHPLAATAGGLALAVLVGAGLWAGSRALDQPATTSAARDPSRVWSPTHAVGKRSTEKRIEIAWSRQPAASSYSVLWNHAPRTEPDAVPDLRGGATGTTSPTLAPGRWYFHLRTKGRDGTWTHTVHLGPFVVAAPPTPPSAPAAAEAGAGHGAVGGGSSGESTTQGSSGDSRATSGSGGGTSRSPETTSPPAAGAPASRDTAPPSGQTVQLSGGPYYRTLAVPLILRRGSDRDSGVDPRTGLVQRSSAVSVDGSCEDWSGWSRIELGDSADKKVVDGRCYRYRYRISDRAGNRSAFSEPSRVATVDTTPPAAPTLTLSEHGADTNALGSTLFYRPTGRGGTFSAAAAARDGGSGLAAIEFPALAHGMTPTGVTNRTAAPYEVVYTWASGAAEAGTKVVTARDRAGNTSSAGFTVTADSTAPSVSLAISGGPWFSGLSVPVVVERSDAGSGIDSRSLTVERDQAPLSAGVCGAFDGTWTTVLLPGGADTSVESGDCYRYRAGVSDNVGNRATSPPSGDGRIDATPPLAPELTLVESSPALYASGATLFYGPVLAGSFAVEATSGDPESGIAQVSFPTVAGATGGGADETAPYEATYSWIGGLAAEGPHQVIASNAAGLTVGSLFVLTADARGPTGMSVTLLAGPTYPGHAVPMRVEQGSDAESGIDAASVRVERDSAPLVAGVCGLFGENWATVALHGSADTSVVGGTCYRYRVSVSDNVGNRAPSPPSGEARVT